MWARLTEASETSSFGTLKLSQNMIQIYTKRYKGDLHLSISGPGAGAQVTAGGVLGDLAKLLSSFHKQIAI